MDSRQRLNRHLAVVHGHLVKALEAMAAAAFQQAELEDPVQDPVKSHFDLLLDELMEAKGLCEHTLELP